MKNKLNSCLMISLFIFCFSLLVPDSAHSAKNTNKTAEIKVSLFGQTCLLIGPLKRAEDLKIIHSISPEQIPPPQSAKKGRQALAKINSATAVPKEFNTYITLFKSHLEGLLAFFDGYEKMREQKNIAPLLEATKMHLKEKERKSFEDYLKSLSANKEASLTMDEFDELLENYKRLIGPNPEEEFHKTIKMLGIYYQCAFGDD